MHSEKIKVFVFVPKIPLEGTPNGVCTYAKELVNIFLNSEKIEIHVVAKDAEEDASADSKTHIYHPREMPFAARICRKIFGRRGYDYYMAWRFVRYVEKKFPHQKIIFEIEEAFGHYRSFTPFTKIPIIVRLHGPWFLNGAALGVEKDQNYQRRVHNEEIAIYQAPIVTAPSQFVLDEVEKYYDKEIKNSLVIFNPFPMVDSGSHWDFSSIEKYVLFVGRFDRHKGADIYIHAMFQLVAAGSDIRGIFVGPVRGPLKNFDGVERDLKDYIAWCEDYYHIASPIQFLGFKNSNEIMALRKKSMVCVISSRVEILPYSVVESLAQGVPTVAAKVGGISELINDGFNGFLFENENIDDLCTKVKILLENPDLATQMSSNALTMAKNFDGPHMAAAYGALYENLLSSAVAR